MGDALFELLDAAIASGLVPSLAHLSVEGLYRRRWRSRYAALADGEVNRVETAQSIGVLGQIHLTGARKGARGVVVTQLA